MAAEAFKNEFGTMNQDLAKTKLPANMYYEAINFRPSTDKGLTDGALENIRGNLSLTNIPNTPAVQKITIDLASPGTFSITITHNGVGITSAGSFTVTASTKPIDLYNFLINDANFSPAIGILYNIYYNNLYLLLNPLDLLTTVITPVAGLILNTAYIPAQTGLEVIGSTYINNDIYLLATNIKTHAPTSSIGQIWKLIVDNVTNTVSTPTLIYNNYLNFSTYNAIAPSAILGRYENSGIQRIYWTDYYNKLRSLNVADPQAFALDVSLIDVQPSIDFTIPIMKDIQSAPGTSVIPVGCYQLSYRLSNTSGATSSYSLPSNLIFVVPNNGFGEETQTNGNNWKYYHGEAKGSTTTKRIIWNINGLDRDFSRIEAIILVRETKNEIPTIKSIFEGPITDDNIDIIFDGDIYNSTDSTSVSLEEYLALNNIFSKVKTLTTKDNRLIVGNVNTRNDAELAFDSRAYRFNGVGTYDVIDIKGTAPTTYTSPTYTTPTLSDAICPFNLLTTDPNYDATSKFRADGVTLGGEGPNISYEFVSIATAGDFDSNIPSDPLTLPLYHTNPDFTTGALNLNVFTSDKNGTDVLQSYNINFPSPINDGMKYPQMNSIYWGYQHNEIYRVGIQFYDKSKNPYFVQWIGDIKMPDYFDTCPGANHVYEDGSLTGFTDYRKSFTVAGGTHGANLVFTCQLGLKLNVTIPANLTDKIEGYSIVRVKREEADKTVIAEGIISNVLNTTVFTNYFIQPIGPGPVSENLDYAAANNDLTKVNFITPNILDSSLATPVTGMNLRISSYLTPSNALQRVFITGAPAIDKNAIYKLYDQTVLGAPFETPINFGGLNGLNGTIINGGNNYANISPPGDSTNNGNPAYVLDLGAVSIPATISGDNKYLAYIYNPITNQYSGNTYTERSNSEYIICSHFRSTKTRSTAYTDSALIYGGDVTNSIMDEERVSKNYSSAGVLHSTTFLYPSSSLVNRELRHGNHPTVSLTDIPTANNDRTDYYYNKVYSCQNDIVKFFPKPDPFISNSEFVNRFYISEIKINGEINDAWSIFKTLNYWDVEGSYGPINGVSILQNEVYFIQDKAFGKLLVNPKTAITSNTGEEIQIGRGNVIDSHDYVSVETGSMHQFSFIKSAYCLYFLDARHNKIYQFSQNRPLNPESDLKGMHGWLINNIIGNLEVTDKPVYVDSQIGINGIHGVYDYINNELIYTLSRGVNVSRDIYTTTSFTLIINEKLNAFTAFYTHYPKNYITNNRAIISADPSNLQNLYLHNFGDYGKFYGNYYPSSIEFISNPNPESTKVFNNLLIQSEVQNGTTLVDTDSGLTPVHETFNSITVSNDHQNSGNIILTAMSNIVRFFRSWRTEVPRHSVSAAYVSSGLYSRMVDKYLKVKLSFQNNGNKRFILHNVISFFKIHSPR